MKINDFKLERYFAAYEFKVRYLLSASDCEALTLEECLGLADEEMLALWRDLKLSYTESQGHPLLRAEAARLYESIAPEQLLIAAPEELIFIAMNVLLAPGDHVITTFPGYQSLYEVAQSLGCHVTRWPLEPGPDGWRLDPDFLVANIRPETRLLVINFPHNPTGYLPSRSDLDRILAMARQHGLYVFSDEMYRLLEYDAAARLPSIADAYERGLALTGLSKSFALPGLRLGWLATRDRALLDRCLAFHDYTTICNSAPGRSWASSRCAPKNGLLPGTWRSSAATWQTSRGSAPGTAACSPGCPRGRAQWHFRSSAPICLSRASSRMCWSAKM